jgi:hypothetical protein
LNDQWIGGLLMGMPVGMIYMGALTNAGERLRLGESSSSVSL